MCLLDIIEAMAENQPQRVKELISSHEVNVDLKDSNATTPLHWASQRGHNDLVTFLISRGASVNILDRWRATPLHYASQNGHTEIVKRLIANGAIPYVANLEGAVPLHLAANAEIAAMLKECGGEEYLVTELGEPDYD
ncbi:MAG: ankyrin repeat domain-containing protein [Candidatus Eremiobacteraeota bacterium]|nr:ankyrin repeat domain-containing protein [Candidatus Eremiobacteraeota bacterium]